MSLNNNYFLLLLLMEKNNSSVINIKIADNSETIRIPIETIKKNNEDIINNKDKSFQQDIDSNRNNSNYNNNRNNYDYFQNQATTILLTNKQNQYSPYKYNNNNSLKKIKIDLDLIEKRDKEVQKTNTEIKYFKNKPTNRELYLLNTSKQHSLDNYVIKMRELFSAKEMLNSDFSINQSYFKTKIGKFWSNRHDELLLLALEKFNVEMSDICFNSYKSCESFNQYNNDYDDYDSSIKKDNIKNCCSHLFDLVSKIKESYLPDCSESEIKLKMLVLKNKMKQLCVNTISSYNRLLRGKSNKENKYYQDNEDKVDNDNAKRDINIEDINDMIDSCSSCSDEKSSFKKVNKYHCSFDYKKILKSNFIDLNKSKINNKHNSNDNSEISSIITLKKKYIRKKLTKQIHHDSKISIKNNLSNLRIRRLKKKKKFSDLNNISEEDEDDDCSNFSDIIRSKRNKRER